jgi:hypothetical protein
MVKETKFFRKQAVKAERMAARTASDAEISERFLNMARAYRSQADVLKAKKLKKLKKLKAKEPKAKKRRAKKKSLKRGR